MKLLLLPVLLWGICSCCVWGDDSVQRAPEQHRACIERLLMQYEEDWVLCCGAGCSAVRNWRFSAVAEAYVARIAEVPALEALFFELQKIDPNEHHLQAWSEGLESLYYYIVRNIAKQGTKEAYAAFIRIKEYRCDGAWAGTLRSLEWKYLRAYSRDPRVLESKNGIFH